MEVSLSAFFAAFALARAARSAALSFAVLTVSALSSAFALNFSTRRAVSKIFCFPVKNGWHALHNSIEIVSTLEPVLYTAPQAQVMVES